jgi:protein-S-isoprenylcysteine O-methyltransferase Ste14
LWQGLVILHLGAIALLYTAFLQSNYLEFLGLRQAYRGLMILFSGTRTFTSLKLFGTHRLVVNGVYRWVRHPMLVGGLLFLLTSGPSLNNIIYIAMYTTYMVIGGYFEEKRMIRVFGQEYRHYQQQVGAYVPRFKYQRGA